MADVKDSYQGQGGQAGNIRWYRDNGDGTYAEEVSSELRAWDTNALAWVKLKVDNTGALSVTTAAGPGGSGVVTQGARDSTFQPWAVSISGTSTVVQGTTPWTTSISGSVPVTGTFFPATQLVSLSGTNLVSQAGSFSVTQGTSPWVVQGGSMSIAGTVLTSISGTTTVAGTVTANQGTSPWIIAGGNVSLAGTSLVSVSGSIVQHQDVGRSALTLFVDRAAGVTSEAAASLSGTRAQASIAASTTYVVTAGKTLRIQSASLEARTTAATTFSVRGRLRVGATSTTGPIVLPMEISTVSALAESTGAESYSFPDGIELPAGTSLSFSHVGSHTSSSMSMAITGFEY